MTDPTPTAPGLGRIVSGLYILTTGEGDEATGMLASFVQQAGFEPPAVTVALKPDRPIVDTLRKCRRFCLSVVHDKSKNLIRHFARGFAPGESAFEGLETALAANGIPYPVQAHAHIACELIGEAASWTDHTVICGRVVGSDRIDEDAPMTHVRRNGLKY